jgi:hypothetical protein
MILACPGPDGPQALVILLLSAFIIIGVVALTIDLSRAWRRHGRAAQRGFEVIVDSEDEQIA